MNALYLLRFCTDYVFCLAIGKKYCSHRSYLLMRLLYRVSKGKSAKILAAPFVWFYSLRANKPSEPEYFYKDLEALRRYGFSRLEKSLLSESLSSQIHYELMNKPVIEMLPAGCSGKAWKTADLGLENNKTSPRLNHQRWDVMSDKKVWSLMHELSLHQLAAYYLRCQPVLTSIESWHVVPIANQGYSERLYSSCAQSYHYDMDWIKFVKVFVNLTRSDCGSGAFEFLLGSHVSGSHQRYTDKRIDDLKVRDGEVVYADGVTGDAFLVDTSGIHRDGRAESASRHVLQYEFAVAAFGASSLYSDAISKSARLIPWEYVSTLFPTDTRLLSLYYD